MAKIVYRQMSAPRELSQQIPPAKGRMQKPQGGANFWCKSPGVRGRGWLWMKLIPALIALGNGMNPDRPLNGCEINVGFCFV